MSTSRILVFALALTLSGYAQTKPNYSGSWKLNVAKSDFGMMPPPDSRTDVITQSSPDAIKDVVTSAGQQGEMNYTLDLKTDGTETPVKVGPMEAKVSGKWEDAGLGVTTKLVYEGNDILIKSNWALAPDNNTLTMTAHITSPMGEMDQKMVFDRQSATAAAASTTTGLPATPSTAAMGAKPNFTGVWKLNVDKSDFGPIPGPESETDTITHTDPALKMAVNRVDSNGKQNYALDININGKEEVHKMGDREVKTTTNWDGNALIVLTKLMFQDNEILIKSAYTLAPDGKTVVVNAHLSSPMGEADQKMVYDKQ